MTNGGERRLISIILLKQYKRTYIAIDKVRWIHSNMKIKPDKVFGKTLPLSKIMWKTWHKPCKQLGKKLPLTKIRWQTQHKKQVSTKQQFQDMGYIEICVWRENSWPPFKNFKKWITWKILFTEFGQQNCQFLSIVTFMSEWFLWTKYQPAKPCGQTFKK